MFICVTTKVKQQNAVTMVYSRYFLSSVVSVNANALVHLLILPADYSVLIY